MVVAHPAIGAVVDDQVLESVARLVAELSGGSARRPALQDSLDRDLGISSLERVELLLRLEQALGVRLPDSVMAEAATPEDLVTAILHAAPPGAAELTPPAVREVAAPTTPAPTSVPTAARSLVESLRWHVERSPDHLFRHAPITVTIGAPVEPLAEGWPEMVRLRDAAVDHIARACGASALETQ